MILLTQTLRADKVDAFVYDPASAALVALGTRHTPLGRRQQEVGLHRLPLGGGRPHGLVFSGRVPHRTGRADQGPGELRGVVEELGVRSIMSTPLDVAGESRGVLQASSTQPEVFYDAGPPVPRRGGALARLDQPARRVAGAPARWGGPCRSLAHGAGQTIARLEDDLRGDRAALDTPAADPDASWKAHLLRWKIRHGDGV